jgi:hypothetical protein
MISLLLPSPVSYVERLRRPMRHWVSRALGGSIGPAGR